MATEHQSRISEGLQVAMGESRQQWREYRPIQVTVTPKQFFALEEYKTCLQRCAARHARRSPKKLQSLQRKPFDAALYFEPNAPVGRSSSLPTMPRQIGRVSGKARQNKKKKQLNESKSGFITEPRSRALPPIKHPQLSLDKLLLHNEKRRHKYHPFAPSTS